MVVRSSPPSTSTAPHAVLATLVGGDRSAVDCLPFRLRRQRAHATTRRLQRVLVALMKALDFLTCSVLEVDGIDESLLTGDVDTAAA